MHSTIFALVAITGLASAKPTEKPQVECQGVGSYYVCGANGFRGYCSNDPCALEWCSDFVYKTCDPVFITKPVDGSDGEDSEGHWEPEEHNEKTPEKKLPEGQCAEGTGFFQVCSNGFKGCCKSDACSGKSPICPDNKANSDQHVKAETENTETHKSETEKTETTKPKTTQALPEGQCAEGTGFFQVCSNGFKGCCKSDACSGSAPICPDTKTVKARGDDPTVCAPGTGFFQSCSNGFRGCCKSDACSSTAPVCPDTKTVKARNTDPTVCPEGTGFFQSCSNGFRGCCKADACSGTAPICPSPKAVKARDADPTVCPQGTGFFQSCSNGFRGCCKGDACGNTWCPDYKTGTYTPAKTMKVKVRSADPTICAPGTGFFQSCSNGFRGCCKKDACGQKSPICPK
ncbi:hypothetical protein FSARC_13988 [Fusarium sarcochroum]|uniref:Uncharacterized protein n=1 Tax=Fusarium sarcochroum TaxID=1208366 RepID=A0A8H4SXE0_9HYPO|nr:hypothetical protein FSARC_13988 [Fusarium sarcochroum]